MDQQTLPVVYADESSSTGNNLLDQSQPVFVEAAVHLSDDLAREILDEVKLVLPVTHGEPKYTSLAKTHVGREALLRAFSHLPTGHVWTYVANKRFMVVTKLVDVLIEQMVHETTGLNMYEDGSAIALANLYFYVGPTLGDGDAFEKVLQTFIDATRSRSRASVDDLFDALATYQASSTEDWRETVRLLEFAREQAEDIVAHIASGTATDLLDPAIPSLAVICDAVAKALGDFRLVHDDCKVIDRNAPSLMNLHKMPDPAHPGQMSPNLKIASVSFSDSKAAPQLQIADWVAGATRQWAASTATGKNDPFPVRLESVVKPWVLGAIWPDASILESLSERG
jgi:hypothetical protein